MGKTIKYYLLGLLIILAAANCARKDNMGQPQETLAASQFEAKNQGDQIFGNPNRGVSEKYVSSGTADWSYKLDATWKCGNTGKNWENWKKSILLFAATNGYSFKAMCNTVNYGITKNIRQGFTLVPMRDINNVIHYVGWYDAESDRNGVKIYGGVIPMQSIIKYDVRPYVKVTRGKGGYSYSFQKYVYKSVPVHVNPIYTKEQLSSFSNWMSSLNKSHPMIARQVRSAYAEKTTVKTKHGCILPYTYCNANFEYNEGDHYYRVKIFVDAPDGSGIRGQYAQWIEEEDDWDTLFSIVMSIGLSMIGGGIGEIIGLAADTAANVAFAAAFSSFTSTLVNGGSLKDAFFNGLKGAGIAYVGKLIVNQYGQVDAKVGVKGIGCPTGDQCWYFELANGFPPLKNLAELHDPFIDFSVKAFGKLADNGWYKAVTIPPFLIPGCAASAGCVATGIVLTTEDEGR